MKKALVSAVVVCFNRKNDIDKCLESVGKQTYKNMETIVVDNHSTDGSVEIIREKYPWARLVIMPDAKYGACETFNIGFATAKGEYVAILDDDVILPKTWVEHVMKKFEKEPESTAMIGTKIEDFNGKMMWPSPRKDGQEFYCGNFTGCAAMVRKDALDKTRYYAEEYYIWGNERELAAQILAKGYKIKCITDISVPHKGNSSETGVPAKKAYMTVRNGLWTCWMHEPLLFPPMLFWRSFMYLGWGVIVSFRHGRFIPVLRGVFDALLGLPRCLKYREVVKAPEWVIRK